MSTLAAASTPDSGQGAASLFRDFGSSLDRHAKSAVSPAYGTSRSSEVAFPLVRPADDPVDCPHLEVLMAKLPGWWRRRDAEFQAKFREIFAQQLRQVGFAVTPYSERLERIPPWSVSSQVLDIGDGTIVWSWELKKQPSVVSGSLHFDRFADPRGEEGEEFSGIRGLSRLSIQEYSSVAVEASSEIAAVFLPHARRLCADRSAALREREGQLERMRERLEQEIEQVRRQRAERQRGTLTIKAD